MKSTNEWRKLLDDAAPWPWEWVEGPHNPGGLPVLSRAGSSKSPMLPTAIRVDRSLMEGRANTRLLRVAPEAVAEVVRLRKAIEELRAECLRTAQNPSGHDIYTPDEVAQLIEEAHCNALTTILEGEK